MRRAIERCLAVLLAGGLLLARAPLPSHAEDAVSRPFSVQWLAPGGFAVEDAQAHAVTVQNVGGGTVPVPSEAHARPGTIANTGGGSAVTLMGASARAATVQNSGGGLPPPVDGAVARAATAQNSGGGGSFAIVDGVSRPATVENLDVPIGGDCVLAYWRFEEGFGSTVMDHSGHGKTGSLVGNPGFDADVAANPIPRTGAANNWSLLFDGNDAVVIPDATSLRPAQGLTIEAFIKPQPGAWVIIGKQIGPGCCSNSYQLELRGGGPLNFILSDSLGGQHMCTGPTLADSVWHHIAGTWDGSTMRLFVNGTQVATTPYGGQIGYDANPVIIAADDDGHGQPGCCFFKGSIDEVRISGCALLPSQFLIGTPVIGVPDTDPLPSELALGIPYPSPFRAETRIDYALPTRTAVRLQVLDLAGRRIATIVDQVQEPGRYAARWRGRDNAGASAGPGVYFMVLEVAGKTRTRKVLLLQ